MVITGMSSGKRSLQADKIGEGPSLGGRDAELPKGIGASLQAFFQP